MLCMSPALEKSLLSEPYKNWGHRKNQGWLLFTKLFIFSLRDCGAFTSGSLLNKKFLKASSSVLGV